MQGPGNHCISSGEAGRDMMKEAAAGSFGAAGHVPGWGAVSSQGKSSCSSITGGPGRQLSFEERRQGAMAARLLAGVQPPCAPVQQPAPFRA
jgi:hypothetical protein